jgi:hypothetical protein
MTQKKHDDILLELLEELTKIAESADPVNFLSHDGEPTIKMVKLSSIQYIIGKKLRTA